MQIENTGLPETKHREVSKKRLDKILRYHGWSAMGVSLIPFPIVDFVAVTGIQFNLLRTLAKAYNIPFMRDKARNLLSPLIGAGIPAVIGTPLAASLTKFIPVLGQTVGVVTMPILTGAATYAIGKVFIQHFASGGTFLTFDPDKVQAYYTEMFQEGQEVAANFKKEDAQKS